MSPRGGPNRQFARWMVLILAVAALAWALLRAWNVMQDHERNDPPGLGTAGISGTA